MRSDLHRLDVAITRDRWYSESGTTQETGTNFGYTGRAVERANVAGHDERGVSRHWSVAGYIDVIKGRGVVRRTFASDWLTCACLEKCTSEGEPPETRQDPMRVVSHLRGNVADRRGPVLADSYLIGKLRWVDESIREAKPVRPSP